MADDRRARGARRIAALFVACAAASALPQAACAERLPGRTVPADPEGALAVSVPSGSVEIFGWDRGFVRVEGSKGKGVRSVSVEQGPRGVAVTVHLDERRARGGDAELVIDAPRSSVLTVDTTTAFVRIDGVTGPTVVETVEGGVVASGGGAGRSRIRIDTVSGPVVVLGPVPDAAIDTVSGEITVQGAVRRLQASSTKGRIRVQDDRLVEGDISAITGEADVWWRPPRGALLDLRSVSGNIYLQLSADAQPRFTVSSFTGTLIAARLLYRGRQVVESGRLFDAKVVFAIGNGSSTVSIRTYTGTVVIANQLPPRPARK